MTKRTHVKHHAPHTAEHTAHHAPKHKHATIHHHHAKPYRRRHVSSLGALTLTAVLLLVFVLTYQAQISRGLVDAQSFVASLFEKPALAPTKVASTYGFSLAYDSQRYTVSALDTATGDIFSGAELSTRRPYDTIRITSTSTDSDQSHSSFKIRFLESIKAQSLADQVMKGLDRQAVSTGVDPATTEINPLTSSVTRISGQEFLYTNWQLKPKTGPASLLPAYVNSYLGVVNGRAVVILVNNGINRSSTTYSDILLSIEFGDRTAVYAQPTTEVAANYSRSSALLDTFLLAGIARAATPPAVDDLERYTSIYSPAVVKIYNVYCTDVLIDSKPYINGACSASTGSGFFVSADGHIATNGHVATSSLKDIVIQDALSFLAVGKSTYFNLLANIAGIKQSDFTSGMSSTEVLDIAVNKFYAIPDSTFSSSKNVHNLLVTLGSKEPDIKELITLTKGYKQFPEQDTIKQAQLIGSDYRAIDGIKTFKASDVAIIKIPGSNFPLTKLGSIDGLIQGANIAILGYPANASDNGIVASDQSKVTVTGGKVSGIKNASGSDNKLIETDTTIGHGNSGGPAMNTSGEIVGIATYTSDGSGKGNGTFNYIRDVKDLINLASKTSVTLGGTSKTQVEWEKGITAFYNSHYKSAVKSFDKVKTLYAAHPKADEFIAAAKDHIAKGDDVPDFPIALFILIAVVVVAGAGVTVFLMLRHKKLHGVYTAGVANGTIAPLTPGAPGVRVALPVAGAPTPAAPVAAPAPAPVTVAAASTPVASSGLVMPAPTSEVAAPQPATPPTASGSTAPGGGPATPIS